MRKMKTSKQEARKKTTKQRKTRREDTNGEIGAASDSMTTGAYVGGLVRKSMLRAHRALTPHPLPNTHAPACTLQHTHHTLAML